MLQGFMVSPLSYGTGINTLWRLSMFSWRRRWNSTGPLARLSVAMSTPNSSARCSTDRVFRW